MEDLLSYLQNTDGWTEVQTKYPSELVQWREILKAGVSRGFKLEDTLPQKSFSAGNQSGQNATQHIHMDAYWRKWITTCIYIYTTFRMH